MGCVPYNGSIYAFGGVNKHHNMVDYIQKYDTTLNTCEMLNPLPKSMQCCAAVWGPHAFVISPVDCLVYDLDDMKNGLIVNKPSLGAQSDMFSVLADNGVIFVVGGRKSKRDEAPSYTGFDYVRYLGARRILGDAADRAS